MNIKYRAPVVLDRIVVVMAETERIDGRKALVYARLEPVASLNDSTRRCLTGVLAKPAYL
jgi:hypothetical protein